MDDRCEYLYAMTWANCSPPDFGPGVDPRFHVELLRCGQIAGLTSRVGLDQFDIAKLQAESADIEWLSAVAVRHNDVVARLTRTWPALPLRMGVLFASQASLLNRLAHHEARVVEFLQWLSDRQEWAVKVYLDEKGSEPRVPAPHFDVAPRGDESGGPQALQAPGTRYLLDRRLRQQRRQEVKAAARREVATVEARLRNSADAWQVLRTLPTSLTGRGEMLYNGALLLAGSRQQAFCGECDELREQLAPEGLALEVSGPWPPYHFCPALEP